MPAFAWFSDRKTLKYWINAYQSKLLTYHITVSIGFLWVTEPLHQCEPLRFLRSQPMSEISSNKCQNLYTINTIKVLKFDTLYLHGVARSQYYGTTTPLLTLYMYRNKNLNEFNHHQQINKFGQNFNFTRNYIHSRKRLTSPNSPFVLDLNKC